MQDRLATIQSHISRLDDVIPIANTGDSQVSMSLAATSASIEYADDEEDHESDDQSRDSDLSRSSVFQSQGDMAGHYHGHSSIFVLCSRFRTWLKTYNQHQQNKRELLCEATQALCDIASKVEPFPVLSDQSLTLQLPQEQVIASVEYYFRNMDYSIDIFVEEHVLMNLRRIYTEPKQPDDEVWLICFRAIVLLVLGTEIASQDCTLFGNFARVFLPSHAGLVNPQLLMKPRLINVQALILLVCPYCSLTPNISVTDVVNIECRSTTLRSRRMGRAGLRLCLHTGEKHWPELRSELK